jgi:hypothetical protein
MTPSGFGANSGDVFMGASIVDREVGLAILRPGTLTRNKRDKEGGSAAVGFGLGDSQELVGLETVYNIISLTPSRFASNGSFDFKLHRQIGRWSSIAVGWENAINYGPEAGGTEPTYYGAMGTVIPLRPNNPDNPMLLGISGGVGDGRFRSISDQIDDKNGLNAFGSIGLQVISNAAMIVEWSGPGLNVGVSYVPFTAFPLFLSATAIDVSDTTGFGTRYAVSASVGFNFR